MKILHYNVLAQRTPTVWRYFAFVDIRWYTLKYVSSSVCVRSQFVAVRWHTLLFEVFHVYLNKFEIGVTHLFLVFVYFFL